MIHPFRQRHLLPVMAPAAILRCVGGIHFESRSTSFCRFAEQLVKKSRPGCILNALSQTMVMGHTLDMKVFDTDHTEPVDDLAAFRTGRRAFES